MRRPRMVAAACAAVQCARPFGLPLSPRLVALLLVLMWLWPAPTASAAPQLFLPTPAGERWKVLQGYNCGSHDSGYERLSLDLINADGPSFGAPVRAAADGKIMFWTGRSGTLILDHGGGFYTQYTHLDTVVTTTEGTAVSRGQVIGTVGNRGASWSQPHLHFNAFTAEGAYARNRRAMALSFAEGYDLPEIGGCNQHGGTIMVAGDQPGAYSPGIAFRADAQPGSWRNQDLTITFGGQALAAGYSMAWNHDPGGDTPAVAGQASGSARLAEAGEGLHTLFVRGWDAEGRSTLATFGPLGYDVTAPGAPEPLPAEGLTLAAGAPASLSWPAAPELASGNAGYRVYVGDDPNGSADWFTALPQVATPPLGVGRYFLRVQPLDFAGNAGAWVTLGVVLVR